MNNPQPQFRVPKVETNSFYEEFTPNTRTLHLNTSCDTREFTTWQVSYKFDERGNYKKIIKKYEDN